MAVRAPPAEGVAFTDRLQDELADTVPEQPSVVIAKSAEFAPPKDALQPVAAVCPELVTVKVFAPD